MTRPRSTDERPAPLSRSNPARRTRMLPRVTRYMPQESHVAEAVDRAVIAVRASQALHRVSVAGLRLRFPDASDEELDHRAGALRLVPS